MTAATSAASPAGQGEGDGGGVGDVRAATPAARRTAVGVTAPSAAAGPRPTSTSSGVLTTAGGRHLTLSPALPVKPEGAQQRAQPAAPRRADLLGRRRHRTGPLSLDRTPTTTASARVLAGLALRSVYVVTAGRHSGAHGGPDTVPLRVGSGHVRGDRALPQSPLHEAHVALGAKLAEFGGWSMPLEYPSGVVKEHTAVREAVGVFDVSHLGKVMVTGPGAAAFVNATLSNDLGKIRPGKAQYTLCCDDATGGIVDDLIAYYQDDEHVLLVPNAANSAEVVRRLRAAAPDGRHGHRPPPRLRRAGGAGPAVRRGAGRDRASRPGTTYMSFVEAAFDGPDVVVCRTGYTGERGYELIARQRRSPARCGTRSSRPAPQYGILPCGLGARDTLRTEMGYPLHGQDITLDVTPVQAGLGWAVGWKKDAFWGRDALVAEKEAGPTRRLRGLVAVERGIPRPGMGVSLTPDVPLCEITSGTFSPTLQEGDRAGAGADLRGRGRRGRRRHPRPPRDLPAHQAPVRRHLGARSHEPARPAPDLPPALARRAAVVVAPRGRAGGDAPAPEEYADQRFASQADAESWVGEVWADLADAGVDAVTLFEHDREVYGPMSLHA